MQKLTIRLLLISVFSGLLFSCKSYEIPNTVPSTSKAKVFTNGYFSNPEKDYIYKAHIDVYGHQLGGIFIAKRISDTLHRVVFTTEFGNKLLDFELSEKSFKVNYIVDDLDRKMVVNTLKEDFRLLLKTRHNVEEIMEAEGFLIYKSAANKSFNYFFESKKDIRLTKIIHSSRTKEKVTFEFDSKNNTFAENITITHKNIKLKIELNQISN